MTSSASIIQMRNWPYFDEGFKYEEAKDWMRQVSNLRKDDIDQFQNLPNILLTGRKVGKVPSASNDVAAEDRLSDFNWTNSYLYILIDNAGTPEWRRATLSSF